MADRLYDDWPRHWTEAPHSMVGVLRVDGHAYRFLGGKSLPETTATQTSVSVHPTRSVYTFTAGEVELRVTFTSSLLLDDLNLLSRPVTYVSLDVRALDGRPHAVALYFDISGEWTVDKPYHEVTWERLVHPDLHIGALRSVEQKPLAHRGDDVRIDWGTLLLWVPAANSQMAIGRADALRQRFANDGSLPSEDWQATSHPANCWGGPVIAVSLSFQGVGPEIRSGHLLIGYDDEVSIEYFHRPLRAWWRRDVTASPVNLLSDADRDYQAVQQRYERFDREPDAGGRVRQRPHPLRRDR